MPSYFFLVAAIAERACLVVLLLSCACKPGVRYNIVSSTLSVY